MQRTNPQGSYYFGILIPKAIEFYEKNQVELIRDITHAFEKLTKTKFEISKEFVHEVMKLRFNDGQTTRFKDGEEKGTVKMNEYVDRIREHFLHTHNYFIPQANEGELWEE